MNNNHEDFMFEIDSADAMKRPSAWDIPFLFGVVAIVLLMLGVAFWVAIVFFVVGFLALGYSAVPKLVRNLFRASSAKDDRREGPTRKHPPMRPRDEPRRAKVLLIAD